MQFFQLTNRRYEHASTVLNSNQSFEQWSEVFGDDNSRLVAFVRTPHVSAGRILGMKDRQRFLRVRRARQQRVFRVRVRCARVQ